MESKKASRSPKEEPGASTFLRGGEQLNRAERRAFKYGHVMKPRHDGSGYANRFRVRPPKEQMP